MSAPIATTQFPTTRRAAARTQSFHRSLRKPAAGPDPRRPRRIMHVSASDLAGGAARAAFRLHESLKHQGEDSQMFVAARQSEEEDIHQYQPPNALSERFLRLARREYLRRVQTPYQTTRPAGLEHFRDDRSIFGDELLEQMPHADIINLHWVADFIDYRRFLPEAAATAPLVWTLHDMNPFTGGCHYDLGCGRFRQNCGTCPQLGSNREDDLSRSIHRRKEQAFSRMNPEMVRIVAGSHWLANAARSSSLLSRFNITTIHCGIDAETFRPRDRYDLRAELNIPMSAFVVLFAADEINNQRKGLNHLLQALHKIQSQKEIFLLSVGGGSKIDAPFPHIHLGKFTNDQMLSIFYNAGDCFVIPSIQEVFGLTALEAMACGTPVVGFDTGGIPDMVRSGETGLLARPADSGDLSAQILWMIEHPTERKTMGENARRMVEREFTNTIQARRYISLYEELEQALPAAAR